MLVLGVTGGIASGKSTVAGMLRDRGARVIEADQVAREVVTPGSPVLRQVAASFGPSVLLANGELDRGALARLIFTDSAARERLNQLTHPTILAKLTEAIEAYRRQSETPVLAVVIPLLIEVGTQGLVDRILVVSCDEAEQVRRLRKRDDLDEAAARQRISSQMPLKEKCRFGDWVIDTSPGFEETRQAVDRLWPQLVGAQAELS